MKEAIQNILSKLPKKPGVYLMKDTSGTIIYTGKSVNLKSRVSSYFMEKASLNFAKKQMVTKVADIEWIETGSEVEALVLETNLIKKHLPKYNILMKDDKNLTYIKITNDPVPEVIKTRKKTSEGTYFWPYTSTTNITLTLNALRQIFHIRDCRVVFWKDAAGKLEILSRAGRSIPCLSYYIGICPAPCVLEAEKLEKHARNIESLKEFLKGNTGKVLSDLENTMKSKAKNLEFEEAAKLKSQIDSIREISMKQIARDAVSDDCDAFVFLEKYDRVFTGIASIRGGEIISVRNIEIEAKLGETKEEIIADFLGMQYAENSLRITLLTDEDVSTSRDLLHELRVSIETPSIWPKRQFLDFARMNLLGYASKLELANIGKKFLTRTIQESILMALGYEAPKKWPIIFECYDISHIAGTHTVASRSVIVNGKSETTKYKRYRIRSLQEGMIDDFASMREVLTRRTKEAIELQNWPHLIIIDGWKGQLSAALGAIEREMSHCEERSDVATQKNDFVTDRKLSDKIEIPDQVRDDVLLAHPRWSLPQICSLAKREEEVFIPGQSDPILFQKWTPELMLIQKIRDEAHRFAITFNRESRNKAMKRNILDELPGFWPKTRSKLLKLAWSIDAIKEVDMNELSKILSMPQIETLRDHGIL